MEEVGTWPGLPLYATVPGPTLFDRTSPALPPPEPPFACIPPPLVDMCLLLGALEYVPAGAPRVYRAAVPGVVAADADAAAPAVWAVPCVLLPFTAPAPLPAPLLLA